MLDGVTSFRLICGDSLFKLKELEPETIDHIVTDPPYNVLEKQDWDQRGSLEEYMSFMKEWMEIVYDLAKPNATMHMFFSQKYIREFLNLKTRWKYKRMLIWHHPNLAKPTRRMYLWTYDPIFYMVKGEPEFDANFCRGDNVDVFRIPKPQNHHGVGRYHPAQKPVSLIVKLLSPVAKPGNIVLDPFMGSGTTALACIILNLNFIGIEIEEGYFNIAQKRISDAQMQRKLSNLVSYIG